MKRFSLAATLFVFTMLHLTGEEVPAFFKGIFTPDEPRKAELVGVEPPAEIEKYVTKVEQSAIKDPKWFTEYSKSAIPGTPLPFHEKLGLTKDEYAAYLKLWGEREYKVAGEVQLVLRQASDKRWHLFTVGVAASLTSLHYSSTEDAWKSTNGTLTRVDDINAGANTTLGAWKGKEWRFKEETIYAKIKENFAIGETGDGKYNLLIYRAQEITSAGTPTLDKSLLLRLPKLTTTPTAPVKTATPAKPAKPKKKP